MVMRLQIKIEKIQIVLLVIDNFNLHLLHDIGSSEESCSKCEQLLMEVMDIRNSMVQFAYDPSSTPDSALALYNKVTNNSGNFQKLELWLQMEIDSGKSGCYLVEDTVTVPDFHLYEMLSQYSKLSEYYCLPPILDSYPNLLKFKMNFEGLAKNKRYFSSLLAKLPLNNKGATFGATPSGDKWVSGMSYDFASSSGVY